jgi:hypothetical protein
VKNTTVHLAYALLGALRLLNEQRLQRAHADHEEEVRLAGERLRLARQRAEYGDVVITQIAALVSATPPCVSPPCATSPAPASA